MVPELSCAMAGKDVVARITGKSFSFTSAAYGIILSLLLHNGPSLFLLPLLLIFRPASANDFQRASALAGRWSFTVLGIIAVACSEAKPATHVNG